MAVRLQRFLEDSESRAGWVAVLQDQHPVGTVEGEAALTNWPQEVQDWLLLERNGKLPLEGPIDSIIKSLHTSHILYISNTCVIETLCK